MRAMRAMGAAEWGMVVALSVLWGGSFFFVGVAIAVILFCFYFMSTRLGLALRSIHDDENVAVLFGVKWALPALFAFMIVVLIFRPYGLYGTPEEARI